MNTQDRVFWQSLDVSVDDILELGTRGTKPPKRLFNKLKDTNGWFEIITEVFGKQYENLLDALENLYSSNKDDFYSIFMSAEFGSSLDVDSIKKRLPETVKEKYQDMLSSGKVAYETMVLPIFKEHRATLQDIFYNVTINKASLKTYESNSAVDAEDALSKVTWKRLEKFFQKMKKKKIVKRNIKLWWFEFRDGRLRILVRLEGVKRKPVHLVDTNSFIRIAGPRIVIFSDGGKKIQVSSRGRDGIAKWAGELIRELTKKDVVYLQSIYTFESDKVAEFLNGLVEERIRNIALIEVQKMNFDIEGNPTITIHSPGPEPLNKSIKDLESNRGLTVISRMDDILSITIAVKGRSYKLMTKTKEGKTTILFDNRNLPEAEKDELEDVLKKSVLSGE
jgi:hypothetical protein